MNKRKYEIMLKQKQYRNVRNKNGITLIALVITIIIMVILAGVSLNATIGENGIISKAQYSTFLSEMTDVEEALKTWQTSRALNDDDYDKKAPTSGLCTPEELQQTKGLMGEVGYYRVWSISASKPTLDLTESSESFDNKYESEFIYYPAGVQDLYYLNNEKLGINKKKKYLIDASTGIIYSVKGANLKGIQCYSLAMAKTVMEDYTDMPSFAELEISTGKNAGNVSNKYKVDENGNYILDGDGNKVENPDYNPYGFEIIADSLNDNIYKLYNNGDLYAKGVKGNLVNTSESIMEDVNPYLWRELNVPSEIGKYKKIIPGSNCVYVIDNNDELWAWGSNYSNKFGLTHDQQIEFTGRDAIKLNIDGKKVNKIFTTPNSTYVVTQDNMLYASGYNLYGNLGVGNRESSSGFRKCIGISDPSKLVSIESISNVSVANLYVCIDDENTNNYQIFYSGSNDRNQFGGVRNQEIFTEITRVFDGNIGADLDQDIKQIKFIGGAISILTKDGRLIATASARSYMSGINIPAGYYAEYSASTFGKNTPIKINRIIGGCDYHITIFEIINSDNTIEYYIYSIDNNYLGYDESGKEMMYNFTNNIPVELKQEGIKDFYICTGNLYIVSNSGKVWATGDYTGLGTDNIYTSNPVGFICLQDVTKTLTYSLPEIKNVCEYDNYGTVYPSYQIFFEGKDGKIYVTGDSSIMFGNNILVKSWIKIASNVKKINATTCEKSLAYIDYNNDAWIVTGKTTFFGITNNNLADIPQFTKLIDVVDDQNINDFKNNIKDIQIRSGASYILTLDNKLYVSGITKTPTWVGNYNIGIKYKDESGNITEITGKYIKILDNVTMFCSHNLADFAVVRDGGYKLYVWGRNDGCVMGQYDSEIPIEVTDLEFDPSHIVKIYAGQRVSYVITDDGSVYTSGYNSTNGYGVNGSGSMAYKLFNKINSEYFNNEKVIDIAFSDYSIASTIALTENGNLYGWGIKSTLGIGTEDTDYIMTPKKISSISNVSSITGGNGFYVCIKKDGSVYGTGSNQYGILGRWIGVDRKTPNSRYKTALDWVECPELEI